MFLGLLLINVKDNVSIEVINNVKIIAILIYSNCVNSFKKLWLFNFVAKIWKFIELLFIWKKEFLAVVPKNYFKSFIRRLTLTNTFNSLYHIIILSYPKKFFNNPLEP